MQDWDKWFCKSGNFYYIKSLLCSSWSWVCTTDFKKKKFKCFVRPIPCRFVHYRQFVNVCFLRNYRITILHVFWIFGHKLPLCQKGVIKRTKCVVLNLTMANFICSFRTYTSDFRMRALFHDLLRPIHSQRNKSILYCLWCILQCRTVTVFIIRAHS